MSSDFPDHFILTVEYDGSAYFGWAVQPDVKTVQGDFARIFDRLLSEYRWTAAGRTDRGVHAVGQLVSVSCDLRIPRDKLLSVLNNYLGPAVRVTGIRFTERFIDIRREARRRTYRFFLEDEERYSPFKRLYRTFLPLGKVDMQLLDRLAASFTGEHDFKNYASHNPAVKNHVRKIERLTVNRNGYGLILEVTANAFLYNMVRRITGTLFAASSGVIAPELVEKILEGPGNMRDKTIMAEPYGLYLWEVEY